MILLLCVHKFLYGDPIIRYNLVSVVYMCVYVYIPIGNISLSVNYVRTPLML